MDIGASANGETREIGRRSWAGAHAVTPRIAFDNKTQRNFIVELEFGCQLSKFSVKTATPQIDIHHPKEEESALERNLRTFVI